MAIITTAPPSVTELTQNHNHRIMVTFHPYNCTTPPIENDSTSKHVECLTAATASLVQQGSATAVCRGILTTPLVIIDVLVMHYPPSPLQSPPLPDFPTAALLPRWVEVAGAARGTLGRRYHRRQAVLLPPPGIVSLLTPPRRRNPSVWHKHGSSTCQSGGYIW